VRDDGCGGADFSGGTGLVGLKDRVEAIGGRIFLDSPRGAGTSLHVELPITAAKGDVALPVACGKRRSFLITAAPRCLPPIGCSRGR